MDLHYVCTGTCGATSATSGVCGDESCPMYNLDFSQCDCQDGQHRQALFNNQDGLSDERPALDEDELAGWKNRFGEDDLDFR